MKNEPFIVSVRDVLLHDYRILKDEDFSQTYMAKVSYINCDNTFYHYRLLKPGCGDSFRDTIVNKSYIVFAGPRHGGERYIDFNLLKPFLYRAPCLCGDVEMEVRLQCLNDTDDAVLVPVDSQKEPTSEPIDFGWLLD